MIARDALTSWRHDAAAIKQANVHERPSGSIGWSHHLGVITRLSKFLQSEVVQNVVTLV